MIFNKDFLKSIKKEWNCIAVKVDKMETIPNSNLIYSNISFYNNLIKIIFDTFKYSSISLIIKRNHIHTVIIYSC